MSTPPIRVCLILACCVVMISAAWDEAYSTSTRETLPNDVGIELAGKSIIYTFHYQRMIGNAIGLEAGLSALGGGTSDANVTVVFVPLGAKLYLIPKDGSVYVAGGVVPITASLKSPIEPSDDDGSDHDKWSTYSYLGLGMEYRSKSGLLFRGTAYGLIAGGGFFIWPGLTVGYAF